MKLLKKYIKNLVMIGLFINQSVSFADKIIEKKCGKYLYSINIDYEYSGDIIIKRSYKLYLKNKNETLFLFFKTDEMLSLSATCVKNSNNKDLFMFHINPGGNAGPEDFYGIFDPAQKKLLLNPNDWPSGDYAQLTKILGYPFPLDSEEEDEFCCPFKPS